MQKYKGYHQSYPSQDLTDLAAFSCKANRQKTKCYSNPSFQHIANSSKWSINYPIHQVCISIKYTMIEILITDSYNECQYDKDYIMFLR